MRTHSFEQNLAMMPDGKAKQIFLKILNTPRPDFSTLRKESRDYVSLRFSQMTEEEKKAYQGA